jgi:NAD(P)-dependent dehydrogenase (short-subunit alcohol dehydrogenase family)
MSFIEELFTLGGKVALVTGAGSGIGRAMALTLARAGAAVVHLGRREEPLRQAVETAEAAGGRAAWVAGDVSRIDELPALAERVCELYGPPLILVNAAGVNPRRPWPEVTPAVWQATLDLNLAAPFFLARLIVPAMQAAGYGRIINVASLQSFRAFPNGLPYGASKGGLVQLTRSMAEAWSAGESGITCNAIAPGFFQTGLTAPLFNDEGVIAALARQTILGRNGRFEDLHGLTVFLASPASGYITGQTISVDGGWSAK